MMIRAIILGGALGLAAPVLLAQMQTNLEAPSALQGFESENAILDTSIPFAAGARESRQELRGSFGWPTFQEGQVDGTYYRFDPDGYARFSTTPRLDTDVFEVICRPRTISCMGRKGPMSMTLTAAGQIQVGFDALVAGDRYFLSDGLSEIQLPDRIFQPLEPQLEAFLATGSEFVVRRGDQVANRISLEGFHPVANYLRWIAARQDYGVLPSHWPIPSSTTLPIQARTTAQPFDGSQLTPTPRAFDPLLNPDLNATQPSTNTEVAEVRGELNMLRQILLDQNGERSATAPSLPQNTAPTAHMDHEDMRLDELERTNRMLFHELQRLKSLQSFSSMAPSPNMNAAPAMTQATGTGHQPAGSMDDHMGEKHAASDMQAGDHEQVLLAQETADQLEYLMSEIGLDAKTALLLIQSSQTKEKVAEPASDNSSYQDALVSDILAELQEYLPAVEDATDTSSDFDASVANLTTDDYKLLTEYFRSVMAAGTPMAKPAP